MDPLLRWDSGAAGSKTLVSSARLLSKVKPNKHQPHNDMFAKVCGVHSPKVVYARTCSQKHAGLCPARQGDSFPKLLAASYHLNKHLVATAEVGATVKISCVVDGQSEEIIVAVCYIRKRDPVLVVSAEYGDHGLDGEGRRILGPILAGEGLQAIPGLGIAANSA